LTLLLAGAAWALGAPGVAVPVGALAHRCLDLRYPALAGPWAVGCGPSGEVDRAVNVETGAVVLLPHAFASPALAPGVVYAPGGDGALVSLDGGAATEAETPVRIRRELVAPAATDGAHMALLTADRVEIGGVSDPARRSSPAHPAGWYPPALSWPWVAWVEDAGDGHEAVWGWNSSSNAPAHLLAAGGGHARHVVGSGRFMGWVEERAVVVMDTASGAQTRYPAVTGFSAPPTLWQDVVCWETREAGDVDIRCSDGLRADGAGDQESPSRYQQWLLYRVGDQVWLRTAGP